MNLYAYAGNNPVTFSDPFGLKVTVGKELQQQVDYMRKHSATFATIYAALDKAPFFSENLHGCSAGCPQETVTENSGGYTGGTVLRLDSYVDDRKYADGQLEARIGHELLEAAEAWGAKASGMNCGKGEAAHACVIRYENVIRAELGIGPRVETKKRKTGKE